MKLYVTKTVQTILTFVVKYFWLYCVIVVGVNYYFYFIEQILNDPGVDLELIVMITKLTIIGLIPVEIFQQTCNYTSGAHYNYSSASGTSGLKNSMIFVLTIIPFAGIFFTLYLTYFEAKKLRVILEKYNGEFILPAERFEMEKSKKS